MKQVANHRVKEADGCYSGIPIRIEGYRLQRNVYGGIEWSDGVESVICRRVGDQWQALVVRNGETRTLFPGLGSQNHALWLAREYLEFGQTYDGMDVWEDLPSRERSNPFRDMISSTQNSFRV
ncbi:MULTISPECIES: hypothetical protein [unclassified Haladaptatus]|uniref:hypothetical protein n=1 Tax=unclassified Haladaptatus TaxID=2622732 RepID=UPI00209BDBD5|nr:MULTISPECIES: hypothetical protein [unclassified Haladaptatus]MCO8247063.1 hypothetical protein [Haladaptatus sp. AB643]MCO8256670.1 hypothetical protein [Haladaptatus sp. AB618]